MPILIVALGVIILLFLIMKVELNTFVALICVSFVVALMLGMDLNSIVKTIESGIGGQLGHLALVFGFGAMLGKLVADAGGAYQIATTLINKFGRTHIQIAVVIASFIIGIALFFEVGLVLLIPIVFAIASELGISVLYLGLPMVAALSTTHGFLPPHPAPSAIATAYGASIGQVLLYGFILAIPTMLIAGPLFSRIAMKFMPQLFSRKITPPLFENSANYSLDNLPSFALSALTSLFPVLLMLIATLGSLLLPVDTPLKKVIEFIGTPGMAMLLSLLFAIYSMGYARKIPMKQVMNSLEQAIRQIGMMLLIIGGGGAFKQVLVDGGVGAYVATLFQHSSLSPLVLAWLIAAILRICLGSATVAALTTAGLVSPLMIASAVNPALMVLATGAGSLIASHVNDAGFWMFKEYFNLSIKETFATWTLLETIISISGLGLVLLLHLAIR